MVKLLGHFGFEEVKKGKTAGSRVNSKTGAEFPLCFINRTQVGL
jgi:hypothetical protein